MSEKGALESLKKMQTKSILNTSNTAASNCFPRCGKPSWRGTTVGGGKEQLLVEESGNLLVENFGGGKQQTLDTGNRS